MSADHRALAPGNRPTMLKADPAYRRRVLLVYATCVPIALGLFVLLKQWGVPMLTDHLRRSGDDGLRLLKMLGIVCMLIPLGACAYLFRLGRRIQASGQVPTPGTRVTRDTPIVYGRAARQLGTAIVALSIVAALVVVGVAVRFARL
jgi:hypothetical protein